MDTILGMSTNVLLAAARHTDFDSILSEVGDCGRYQILLFFLICLPACVPSAFSAFNQPFVVGLPEHKCLLPDGRTDLRPETDDENILNCKQYNQSQVDYYKSFTSLPMDIYRDDLELVDCQNGWEYDNSTYINSLVTEFDLVCDKKHWIEITGTAFYVGSFIGNILFGYIADKLGRRVSFFIILLVLVVFGTLNSFANSLLSFTVLRFFTGLPFPALFQIPFIISMEMMGNSGRIFSGLMISMFFAVGMLLLGVVAMFIRRWRELTLICNAPFVILFTYYFFLPESPRWLVSVGRFEDAKKVLENIKKMNGRTVEVDGLITKLRSNRRGSVVAEDTSRHNVLDLFKTPNLRIKTILVTYIWVMNAVIYNGLTLNISNLPVDDYVSFIINGAIELPAYFIVWPLLHRIGRRWSLIACMTTCGFGCLAVMFAPDAKDHPWVIASMAFIGKFGVGAGFAVIYIFAGELYPTVLRAVGMGMSSMVAGMGLLAAPHLVALGYYARVLPLLLMGLMSVTASIATLFLPETLGAPLPQTLEDAENFGKTIKPSKLSTPYPIRKTQPN